MMRRFVLFAAFVFIAGHAFAQAAPRAPQTPQAPQAPQTPQAPPAPAASVPPPPPPPAPPGPPRREGQPINVKVELTITEEGAGAPPVKKNVSAVVGDGFNGYVREQGVSSNVPLAGAGAAASFDRIVAPLNLDVYPVILATGKIRLTCTIQYGANQRPPQDDRDRRISTDIKQNLVLILESAKSLVVSEATDPITDRRVTVEVKATILR